MSDNRWSGVHGKNSGLDGDKTSTGAVCSAGSQGWSVNGRRKLYVAPCPKCRQPAVIAVENQVMTKWHYAESVEDINLQILME